VRPKAVNPFIFLVSFSCMKRAQNFPSYQKKTATYAAGLPKAAKPFIFLLS
jgi:hypothetical protein